MLLTTAMTTVWKNLPPDLPLIQQKHRQMNSEQTVTVSVTKSWITNYKTSFDQDSYVLRLGETLTPNITPIISLINQFGPIGTVLDTPTVSINDPSIATYSDGKIIGLKEGTTTLTTITVRIAINNFGNNNCT